MKEKKNKLGTYDCSDIGNLNRIFPTVYGSDHCL